MVILILTFFGCQKSVKVKNKSIQSENIDLSEINDIWCEIKFPDTVFKNSNMMEKYSLLVS
jgi:hypothetical protein